MNGIPGIRPVGGTNPGTPGAPGSSYRIVGISRIPGTASGVGSSNGTGFGNYMNQKVPITITSTNWQFWVPSFLQSTFTVASPVTTTNARTASVRLGIVNGGAVTLLSHVAHPGVTYNSDILGRRDLTAWSLGMTDRWQLPAAAAAQKATVYIRGEMHGNRTGSCTFPNPGSSQVSRGENSGVYGFGASGQLTNQLGSFFTASIGTAGGQPQLAVVPIGIPSGVGHGFFFFGTSRVQGGSDSDATFLSSYCVADSGYLRAPAELARENAEVAALNLGVTGLQVQHMTPLGQRAYGDGQYVQESQTLFRLAASAGPHVVLAIGINDGSFSVPRVKEGIIDICMMIREAQISEQKGGRLVVFAESPFADVDITRASAQGLTVTGATQALRYASLVSLNPTRTQWLESQIGSGADAVRMLDMRFWTLGTGGGYSTTGFSVTLTGSASVTGGTWGISVFGTRVNFAHNASAATIKAGIDAVLPAGTTCTVTGGPLNTVTPIVITYSNAPASVLHNPYKIYFESLTPGSAAHLPLVTACTATLPQCIPTMVPVDVFGATAAQNSLLEWVWDKKDTGEASTSAGGYCTADGIHESTAGYLAAKVPIKTALQGIINGTL